jgi:non-heme chloroperoxidase
MLKKALKWGLSGVGVVILVLALMIAFGGGAPPPMPSVVNAVAAVDRSDLPPISTFPARDGGPIAYRA